MNAIDRNILLRDYLNAREDGNNPALLNHKERITEDLLMFRQMCKGEGYTQAQLDAAWEDWKHDNR